MSLREDTFRKVAEHLKEAVADLQKAGDVLKHSDYWANTSEYHDILALMHQAKSLARDFETS